MFIAPVTNKEVKTIMNGLKNSSAGCDSIKPITLKAVAEEIAEPLTHVINLSISQGIVPSEMKLGRVVPIFKAGCHSDFSNFRPVSVLPCYSKILERVSYDRISYLVTIYW